MPDKPTQADVNAGSGGGWLTRLFSAFSSGDPKAALDLTTGQAQKAGQAIVDRKSQIDAIVDGATGSGPVPATPKGP